MLADLIAGLYLAGLALRERFLAKLQMLADRELHLTVAQQLTHERPDELLGLLVRHVVVLGHGPIALSRECLIGARGHDASAAFVCAITRP